MGLTTMAFVTRFHIEDEQGRFWTGADFTRDETIAEEYRDREEAETDAAECGGTVEEFQRFAKYPDLPRAPLYLLEAAE